MENIFGRNFQIFSNICQLTDNYSLCQGNDTGSETHSTDTKEKKNNFGGFLKCFYTYYCWQRNTWCLYQVLLTPYYGNKRPWTTNRVSQDSNGKTQINNVNCIIADIIMQIKTKKQIAMALRMAKHRKKYVYCGSSIDRTIKRQFEKACKENGVLASKVIQRAVSLYADNGLFQLMIAGCTLTDDR